MNRAQSARRLPRVAALVFVASLIAALAAPISAHAEVITIRSGDGLFGGPDACFTYLAGAPAAPLSGAPFTPADFAAALSGPPAIIVSPFGPWLPSLACDPLARWISTTPGYGPASALYACEFDIATCCIGQATLTFCWSADDYLGDFAAGGPNPAGVYINGTAVTPIIEGGSYATESFVAADVTGLVHCGTNAFFVYDRDGAAVVTGAMFGVTIDIVECPVKTEDHTWSHIKALYR